MENDGKLSEFLNLNNLYALFKGKTNGDIYKVVVEEVKRFSEPSIWCFGRVYEVTKGVYTYMPQGCKSYSTKNDAIQAACKFFGVKDEFFVC